MRLDRIPYAPGAAMDFYEEGLTALGAICERTWHDRLHIIAEGTAAKLWSPGGELVEKEIHFPPPEDTAPRQADREVFPGCPLTFHLTDALNPPTLVLQRVILPATDGSRPPTPDVAEKLWHLQFPGSTRWRMQSNFRVGWHFSLVILARCEIQAIDQHWSLHRLALSLPLGEPDDALAQNLDFLPVTDDSAASIPWPVADPTAWQKLLKEALARELESDLTSIRQRQENYLQRELDRIRTYFEGYEQELRGRRERQRSSEAKIKLEDRLAAAKAEHERRRLDQVQRHEIRVVPHLDSLLLLAEPAWSVTLITSPGGEPQTHEAGFIPRTRRWVA